MRAIPEHLRGVFTTTCYTKLQILVYLTLAYLLFGRCTFLAGRATLNVSWHHATVADLEFL